MDIHLSIVITTIVQTSSKVVMYTIRTQHKKWDYSICITWGFMNNQIQWLSFTGITGRLVQSNTAKFLIK